MKTSLELRSAKTERRQSHLARRDEEIVAYEFRSTWIGSSLLTVLTPEKHIALGYIYNLGHTTGDLGGSIEIVAISRSEARTLGRKIP